MAWLTKGDILIRGDVYDREVVAKAKHKAQALADRLGRTVQIDFMNRYGSGRGKGFRAPLTQVHPRTSNPSIRAQVRRLPSGQIQLKIPLRRGENALRKAHEIAKALGRKVVSVGRARKR